MILFLVPLQMLLSALIMHGINLQIWSSFLGEVLPTVSLRVQQDIQNLQNSNVQEVENVTTASPLPMQIVPLMINNQPVQLLIPHQSKIPQMAQLIIPTKESVQLSTSFQQSNAQHSNHRYYTTLHTTTEKEIMSTEFPIELFQNHDYQDHVSSSTASSDPLPKSERPQLKSKRRKFRKNHIVNSLNDFNNQDVKAKSVYDDIMLEMNKASYFYLPTFLILFGIFLNICCC